MAGQQDIDRLVDKLSSPNWKIWVTGAVRAKTAYTLGQMGPSAVPSLIGALSRPGAAYAVLALREIGSAAIPSLVAALSGPGAGYAVLALEEIGEPAIPACLDALDGEGGAYAAIFFKKCGALCVPELIDAFRGEGHAYASVALTEIGSPAVSPLTEALKDRDATVRMWAALTLGEIGKQAAQAIPMLRAAQGDADDDVSEAARQAIEKIEG